MLHCSRSLFQIQQTSDKHGKIIYIFFIYRKLYKGINVSIFELLVASSRKYLCFYVFVIMYPVWACNNALIKFCLQYSMSDKRKGVGRNLAYKAIVLIINVYSNFTHTSDYK